MKTSQLILALQQEDPTGELDVVVGNLPIFRVHRERAYYDGKLQRLIRDDTNPYYNVVGAEITSEGHKVQINTLSIQDAILDNPDIPIKATAPSYQAEEYRLLIDKWRRETKELIRSVDEEIEAKGLKKAK